MKREEAKLVAAWKASKRATRRQHAQQRLASPAPKVEPGPVLAAWEAACERDDAREAETRSPNVTCLKYAAQRDQDTP